MRLSLERIWTPSHLERSNNPCCPALNSKNVQIKRLVMLWRGDMKRGRIELVVHPEPSWRPRHAILSPLWAAHKIKERNSWSKGEGHPVIIQRKASFRKRRVGARAWHILMSANWHPGKLSLSKRKPISRYVRKYQALRLFCQSSYWPPEERNYNSLVLIRKNLRCPILCFGTVYQSWEAVHSAKKMFRDSQVKIHFQR